MAIITVEEIDNDLKKRKTSKMSRWELASLIHDYVIKEVEDQDISAFQTGKEEGRAELQAEIDDKKYDGEIDESHLLYAIEVLQEVFDGVQNPLDKIKELEILSCRYL